MDYTEMIQNMDPTQQKGFVIGFLIALVLLIIAKWKIFTKAGQAGWKSIIPLYSDYIFVKIADSNGWKFILYYIPVVNIVYYILFNLRLAKAYGKGTGFAIGLMLIPNLFTLILGFGGAQYIGPRGEQQHLPMHK